MNTAAVYSLKRTKRGFPVRIILRTVAMLVLWEQRTRNRQDSGLPLHTAGVYAFLRIATTRREGSTMEWGCLFDAAGCRVYKRKELDHALGIISGQSWRFACRVNSRDVVE